MNYCSFIAFFCFGRGKRNGIGELLINLFHDIFENRKEGIATLNSFVKTILNAGIERRYNMSTIVRLNRNEYKNIKHLFKDTPLGWDVIFSASLDYGFVLADNVEQPNIALSFIGGCIIYGGDANHNSARDLIHSMEVQPAILSYPESWAALVKDEYKEKAKIETRYYLPFASLDKERLLSIDLSTNNGYRIERIDEQLAEKLKGEIGEEYQIYHYPSLRDFAEKGCGFCITNRNEICSAAAAFLRSGNKIQIQVNTKQQYRQQGMATKTSAYMLRYCLENGITADWDAANTHSRDLAYKLGYTECISYGVISVFPE